MASDVRELRVYPAAFEAALEIHRVSEGFPSSERYSLTDQVRRASRSVCANLAEAWCRRGYRNHFVAKLGDAQAEAAETGVWLDFALRFEYLDRTIHAQLADRYDHICRQLELMAQSPNTWLKSSRKA